MIGRDSLGVLVSLAFWFVAVASLAFPPMTHGGEPDGRAAPPWPPISIRLSDDQSRIEVVGVPTSAVESLRSANLEARHWSDVLRVTVLSDRGEVADAPAVMGGYRIDADAICFTPRFPFRAGLTYRVVFDVGSLEVEELAAAPTIDSRVMLPERTATTPTEVEAVFPSGSVLPANLLKFYIHFSAPMSRGDDYQHVRIVDAKGRTVPGAFLELPQELWDASGRRLTILFDPGRLKRGLKPNEDVGSPLSAGQAYALVVSAGWRDANGEPLAAGLRKEFRVVEPDRDQPDPAAWRVSSPPADSLDPLTVTVNEPLDRALFERSLEVVDAEGRGVDGEVIINEEETLWQFRPKASWQAGHYRIVVDSTLEDRAGNSIGRAFETHDSAAPVGADVDDPTVLHFVVAP